MLVSPEESKEICQEVDLGPHTLEYAHRAIEQNGGCFFLVALFSLFFKKIDFADAKANKVTNIAS